VYSFLYVGSIDAKYFDKLITSSFVVFSAIERKSMLRILGEVSMVSTISSIISVSVSSISLSETAVVSSFETSEMSTTGSSKTHTSKSSSVTSISLGIIRLRT